MKDVLITRDNKTLLIPNITSSSSGNYTCIAHNKEGSEFSNTQHLFVKCRQNYSGFSLDKKLYSQAYLVM